MSWRDIVKLSEKQKKLDKNHNGVIDAQDFHIMNGSKEMEKVFIGNKVECPVCGDKFMNQKAHDVHHQREHSGSNRRNAFTGN